MRIVLPNLASEQDLWRSRTTPVVAEQLRCQGRTSVDGYRYEVAIDIVEGKKRPASDVDNYAKRIMDAITQSQLLWRDDHQIDKMIIRRRRERRRGDTQAVIRARRISGQHLGVPTFFRACCHEASRGNEWTYAHPGYHLVIHLWDQQPYDFDEDKWSKEIERLTGALDQGDDDGVWNWFKEHFPKCMRLVPSRRKDQFVAGVRQAYEEEAVGR
jgi:Holliday junction resolvase RusA-like endonuclease